MATIVINTPLPSLNDYINAERSNKLYAAKIKQQTTNNVCYLAKQFKVKIEKPCDIKFTWFKPDNKTDHDNIAFTKKFILDGLVKAGVLQNDTPRFVRNFQDVFEIDRTRNYVGCIIEFIEYQ